MRGKSWPTCHVTTMPSRAQCRLIMALQKSWCALKIVIAPTLSARLTFLTHSVEKIIWQAIFLRQQKTIQNMLNLTRICFTMFKKLCKKSQFVEKNYNFSKVYFSREIVIFVRIYTRKMTTFKKWDIFGNFHTLCILIYYPILKLEFRRSLHHAIRHKLKMTNPPFLQKL